MSQKRIKKLIIKNLKGSSREIEFTAKNIFCGDNGSGKSAILDAIKLALLGEHDQLGKQGKSLMQLGYLNDGETSATLEFEDGDICSFSIEPRGKTGKTSHTGIPVEPSLRLNLCPEEFWGKGDTARMETLLQMCGDGSLVTKDFISACILRVRVADMTIEGEDSDMADVQSMAGEARETIIDGDISTLAEVEKNLAERRADRNRELKQLTAVANNLLARRSIWPLEDVTEEENAKVHLQMQELLSKSEKIGKKIAKEERDMAKRDDLVERKAALDAKNDDSGVVKGLKQELEANNEALSLVKEKVEDLISAKSPDYTKLVDNSPAHGFMYRVKGNAVFTGSSFAMVNNTVSWAKDGLYDDSGNDKGEDKDLLLECQIKQNALEIKNKELAEQMGIPPLTEREEQFLEKNIEVDYKANIHALSSEMAGFSVKLEEFQGKMEEIAESRAKAQQRVEIEKKLEVAERKCRIIKSVLGTVRDMQKDIVSLAVDDALEVVNAVTWGIIYEDIVWDGKKMGRRLKNGTWVPIDTFSGAEKAVTQMGLGVALAGRSNFRLAVLDEVSRLDQKNQNQLFLNLSMLVDQGRVDQYLGFCIEAPALLEDENIINVGEIAVERITPAVA
jgi:DNA repair exonuclease SbcCD ATPase subunit